MVSVFCNGVLIRPSAVSLHRDIRGRVTGGSVTLRDGTTAWVAEATYATTRKVAIVVR